MRVLGKARRRLFLALIAVTVSWSCIMATRKRGMDDRLLACVNRNDARCVAGLIDSGADPDGSGFSRVWTKWRLTRIIFAAMHMRQERVPSTLIATEMAATGVTTTYPYRFVYSPECAIITATLLRAGANANCLTDDGDSALIAAIQSGKFSTAMVMVQYGANPNTIWRFNGHSALMCAVQSNQRRLVGLLIAKGADVKYATSTGETALSLAKCNGIDPSIARRLSSEEAKWLARDRPQSHGGIGFSLRR
jgi:hypothetical protein